MYVVEICANALKMLMDVHKKRLRSSVLLPLSDRRKADDSVVSQYFVGVVLMLTKQIKVRPIFTIVASHA